MLNHARIPRPVVSQAEWLAARRALLAKEKKAVRLRDELNAERLALPWVKVEKDYRFDTPDGRKTLVGLFDGRSQLIVYHFMLGPEELIGTLMILDRAPKGRNETTIMDFVRRHDEYETAEPRNRCATAAKA